MMRFFNLRSLFAFAVLFGALAPASWAEGRSDAHRQVRFVNERTGEKAQLQLITRFGTINNRSRQNLSRIAGPEKPISRTILLHPRLILMLQRIADQYPGKTIVISSGYRLDDLADEGHSDMHSFGRATDLHVSGVKNEELYDFVKTLPKCGTGYYPKARFVHIDVREESATWVDFFHTAPDCRVAKSTEKHSGRPIDFLSIWNNEDTSLQLVNESGVINNRSRQILSRLANSRVRTKRTVLLHPRLLLMLQKVADEFPGHRFEIISGHRLAERGFHSYHNFGRALDFRLSGVDNKKLYDFILALPSCGTGYYPNSVFVHLDVRDRKTTWVDYSGVGEASQYKKPKDEPSSPKRR